MKITYCGSSHWPVVGAERLGGEPDGTVEVARIHGDLPLLENETNNPGGAPRGVPHHELPPPPPNPPPLDPPPPNPPLDQP